MSGSCLRVVDQNHNKMQLYIIAYDLLFASASTGALHYFMSVRTICFKINGGSFELRVVLDTFFYTYCFILLLQYLPFLNYRNSNTY